MKQSLKTILEDLNREELDVLLPKETAFTLLDKEQLKRMEALVLKNIQNKGQEAKKQQSQKRYWRVAIAAVAGVALLLTVGFGVSAYAAERREYEVAIRFFDENELSTEGLSRGEIKSVYQDITTNTFAYSKTAEVIEKSISINQVEGFEILQENPTPEDIENLWNYQNCNRGNAVKNSEKSDIYYEYRGEYKVDEELGFEIFDKSYLEKYEKDKLLWCVTFTEFWLDGYIEVKDGILVYGETSTWSSEQDRYAWVAKLDNNGNILWKQQLKNGFHHELIGAVIENTNGTYAVITRGDYNYLCLSQYAVDGTLLSFTKTEVGNYGIWNAARLGDGYIIQLGNYTVNENARWIKMDSTGIVTDSFVYQGEDCYYYITDMIEFEEKVYLSAYIVPKLADEDSNAGGRYDIAAVLNHLFDNNIWEISSEELTLLVRENYTAMLLVCNPMEGTPQEFYSVKGSLGGELTQSDSGKLLWNVESITDTYFSPLTSAYTIGGTSYVYQYVFDETGILVKQEKTGKTTGFYR